MTPAAPPAAISSGRAKSSRLRCCGVVRRAIEDAGATLLFLPPYSPDLNPIEQLFARLKALLRATALRTVDAHWKALGSVTDCVSPQECKNFVRQAGYFQSG